MLCIFRTRGVRDFCAVAGCSRPNYTWLFACILYASEREYVWTMVIVQICITLSIQVIFLQASIGIGICTCRLVLDLEFAAVDLRGVDSLTGHLFALSFSCIFLFIQLHCLYCERNLFHCIETQKIVLYQLIVLY